MSLNDIIKIVCIALIAGLAISTTMLYNKTIKYKNKVTRLENNVLAYNNELDSAKKKNIEYIYTIDELKSSNDSILQKLNTARKELKIKDKQLERLGYLESELKRKDTVFVKDTIFKEGAKVDTTIFDNWYRCDLSLRYPGTIVVEPSFKSEKYIIMSTEKTFVGERKKCFILRLFQKRQTVVDVTVVEKSPYIQNKKEKFINVLQK